MGEVLSLQKEKTRGEGGELDVAHRAGDPRGLQGGQATSSITQPVRGRTERRPRDPVWC